MILPLPRPAEQVLAMALRRDTAHLASQRGVALSCPWARASLGKPHRASQAVFSTAIGSGRAKMPGPVFCAPPDPILPDRMPGVRAPTITDIPDDLPPRAGGQEKGQMPCSRRS